MSWLALVQEHPDGATAAAEVSDLDTGAPAGWLAFWDRRAKPLRHALRADPAAFAADGPPAVASYLLYSTLFDDPAVQRARQLVMAGGPWTAVTTLVSDATHFRGSLVAMDQGDSPLDPFWVVGRGRWLRVGPGLLSAGPLQLPAPVVERYAGRPWPQSGF